MPKVILIGTQQNQWNIGDSFKPGGLPIDLTDAEITKYKSIILENLDKPTKKPEVSQPKTKVYTKEEIDKKGRSWQINFLEKNNIKPARFEKDRIKQILKVQK